MKNDGLSARCPKLPGKREIWIWTKIWGIIQRTSFFIWRIDWISHKPPNSRVKIWEEDILITDDWGIWKFGVIKICFRRLNETEVLKTQRDEEFVFPMADGSAKLSGRDYEFQEPTLRRESIVRKENLCGESHGDREEFQTKETKDDGGINKDFWAHAEARKDFYRHHIEPRSSIARAEKRIIFCSLSNIDVISATFADLESAQGKEFVIIGMSIRKEIYQHHGLVFIRFMLLNGTPSERKNQPGVEGRDWWKFRRHHVQVICGMTYWQAFEKANMHTGNRYSEITKSLSVWSQKFISIDIAGERRNSA